MNIGYSICYVWNILTRPNYIGALLVIAFLHYRLSILNFIYRANNDGIIQTFFSLIFSLADLIRRYYLMFRETIRSLGQNDVFSSADENDGTNYVSYPMLKREPGQFQKDDIFNVPTRNNNHKRHSPCGPPPPLMVINSSDVCTKDGMFASKSDASLTGVTTGLIPRELDPLEPAFLNKEDYPPGWLVFHSVLGICSVKDLDQYNEQESSTKMRYRKQHHHQKLLREKKHDQKASNEPQTALPEDKTTSRNLNTKHD